jgi:hypothetical protein
MSTRQIPEVDGFGRPFRIRRQPAPRIAAGRTGLRRIESGLYSTPDGLWGIARAESMGEWDDVDSLGWVIIRGDVKDGEELPTIYRTKAEAAAALPAVRAENDR